MQAEEGSVGRQLFSLLEEGSVGRQLLLLSKGLCGGGDWRWRNAQKSKSRAGCLQPRAFRKLQQIHSRRILVKKLPVRFSLRRRKLPSSITTSSTTTNRQQRTCRESQRRRNHQAAIATPTTTRQQHTCRESQRRRKQPSKIHSSGSRRILIKIYQ